MATQTARVIAEQQKEMYNKEMEARETKIAMESKKAEADNKGVLVQSSIDLKNAENLG